MKAINQIEYIRYAKGHSTKSIHIWNLIKLELVILIDFFQQSMINSQNMEQYFCMQAIKNYFTKLLIVNENNYSTE